MSQTKFPEDWDKKRVLDRQQTEDEAAVQAEKRLATKNLGIPNPLS